MEPLVVATNENDILERFWKTGIYEKKDSSASHVKDVPETEVAGGSSDGHQANGGVKETLSPAMDILVSSNFERLLWYLAYDTQAVPPSGVVAPTSVAGAGDAGDLGDRVRRAQATVAGWMADLKKTGRVDLSSILTKAKEDFLAERVSDEEVSGNMLPKIVGMGRLLTGKRFHVVSDRRANQKILHCERAIRG
jgi:threonine synthase